MIGGNISSDLLFDVKNYLNITWNDTATENKIRGLIVSAEAYLDDKAGQKLNYEKPGEARTLMMDYVRYMRDEAGDVFENNYKSRLIALQNNVAVARSYEDVEVSI